MEAVLHLRRRPSPVRARERSVSLDVKTKISYRSSVFPLEPQRPRTTLLLHLYFG